MIIAVNAVTPAFKPAATDFLQELIVRIAAARPEHRFLLIGFTANNKALPPNCMVENSPAAITSPLRFLYWLNYRLPSLLKKHKADILISSNSCSLRLKIPQLLFCDDLSFLKHPEAYPKNWLQFFKKNTVRFVQKAVAVVSSAAFLAEEIKEQYGVNEEEIHLVYAAASPVFKPAVHWNQQELMKQKLTGGKEYFLYSGLIHTSQNLVQLLKAFSFFKQRQKSNMQLVLASAHAAEAAFLKSLASYKYRTEVVVAESITSEELSEITAAAYAAICPQAYDATGTAAMQALQCSCPVIAANTGVLPEICGEAAVYCYANDFNDIAAKMMLLFTNEDRRNQLIARGRTLLQKFDMGIAQQQLWEALVHISGQ